MSVDFNLRYLLPVSKLKEKVTDVEIVYKDDSMWLTSQIDGEECTLLAKRDENEDEENIYGFTAYMGSGGIKLFEKLFHILKIPFLTDEAEEEMYYKQFEIEEEYLNKCVSTFGYVCKRYQGDYIVAKTTEELDRIIKAKDTEVQEQMKKIPCSIEDIPF